MMNISDCKMLKRMLISRYIFDDKRPPQGQATINSSPMKEDIRGGEMHVVQGPSNENRNSRRSPRKKKWARSEEEVIREWTERGQGPADPTSWECSSDTSRSEETKSVVVSNSERTVVLRRWRGFMGRMLAWSDIWWLNCWTLVLYPYNPENNEMTAVHQKRYLWLKMKMDPLVQVMRCFI